MSELHIRFPSPGVLHQEGELPEHLALKASGDFFGETQRAVGDRDSTLKGAYKLSHTPGPRVEAVI